MANLAGLLLMPLASVSSAQSPPVRDPVKLSLADCIRVGLQNQSAIQAQMAAAGAARQQEAIARSYFYPQIDFQTSFTHANAPQTVTIPSPIAGQLADVVADSSAYFGIARQAGSAAAQAALNNPNTSVAPGLPSFNMARQETLNALPASFDVGLLGQDFVTSQVLLVQPLWTGGKIRYRHEQAELGAKAAEHDVERVRQETTFNITRAYLTILLAGEMVQVAEDTAGRFRAIESLARSLVKSGNEYVTTADMYRAGSMRYMAEGEKVGLEHLRQRAYAGLRLAMGVDQQSMLQIADQRLAVGRKEIDATTLLRQAVARRPDLAKAEIGVKVAALERQLAKAAFCPEIGAFASFSTVYDDGHYANPNERDQGTVGIGGQVPLFAGGRRIAQSRQADCLQAQATQVRQLLAELVSQEVQDAYLEYCEASQRLSLEEQAVQQGIQALKSYDDQYVGGQIEDKNKSKYFEDLILARRMLTEALARYYQSVYNSNLALGRIRLVTACDEYQTFVESGGSDARVLDDAGRAAARDYRR